VEAAPANLVAGVKVAVTQRFLDYARDIALPLGLKFLQNLALPDISGDKDSIHYSVSGIKLDSVNANAGVTLASPNVVGITISGLAISMHASVQAKEDVWPHPSVSGGVKASTSSSSGASISIAIAVAQGIPTASLAHCKADVDIDHIDVSGLGILDSIAGWIADQFKGDISSQIASAICDEGIGQTLIPTLNTFLHHFAYQEDLPLPAPFDRAELDNHLVSAPAVVVNGSTSYLEMDVTAEVFTQDNHHAPFAPAALPHLSAAQLGARMVSTVLGEYPVNSALWTFWSQGALAYVVHREDLPEEAQGILNTADYKMVLMPKLYDAYPDHNMTVTVGANTAPVWRVQPDHLTLSCNASLTFRVVVNATYAPLAFSLWTMFSATVHLNTTDTRGDGKPPRVVGSVDDVSCELHEGLLPYGGVAEAIVTALSVPANLAINYVLIPKLNKGLQDGVPIPPVVTDLSDYELTLNFVMPRLRQFDGYLLLGTDVNATIQPKAAAAAAGAAAVSA